MTWWQQLLVFLIFFPPVGFVGGWCRRCRCDSCTFFTDNFNRADSDDPGDYTEVSGDWDISGNRLVTSSDDAIILADAAHPGSSADIKLNINVIINTSGDVIRIYFSWQDSDNHWYIEIKTGSGSHAKLFQVSGGSPNEKFSYPTAISTGTYGLCLSIDNGLLHFYADTGGSSVDGGFVFVDTFSFGKWGLGTGSISTTFRVISVSANRVNSNCPPCTLSCTGCVGDVGPRVMKLVVSGIANASCSSCNSLNATYYPTAFEDCSFSQTFTNPCGGLTPGQILFDMFGPSVVLTHYRRLFGTDFQQILTYSGTHAESPPDCFRITGLSLAFSSSSGSAECDGSSSSISVYSLGM